MMALLVKGVFHWGFSVRLITESAAAQWYPVPPPSTLIGALAYGVSLAKGLPECEIRGVEHGSASSRGGKKRQEPGEVILSGAARLLNVVRWATFAFSDELSVGGRSAAVGCSDFIRAFRLIYRRKERHEWEDKDMWFGIGAHGKVYACGTGFKALYIIDEVQAERKGLSAEDLCKAAFSIVRFGAKEGLVSVRDVELTDSIEVLKPNEVDELSVEYYFPRELAEAYSGAEIVALPKLRVDLMEFRPERPPALHDHEEYLVPEGLGFIARAGKIRVRKLSQRGVALRAKFGAGSETVIVPKEVVEVGQSHR